MDKKFGHLQFIQGVINRLASNSFQMKGWSVVLVAAILVLLAREDRLDDAPIALVPVLIFWFLDGYFLRQERLFRALYDQVRDLKENEIDFSMDIKSFKKKHYFLATYLHGQVELPSYLKKWPILRSMADIDKYCELSHRKTRDRRVVFAREHTAFRRETGSARIAANFHTELRRALGQIPY